MMSNVTLREYLEALLSGLEERLREQRKGDRKQLLVILRHQAKALRLQAKEYERRLLILNNAHEEAREIAAKQISPDTYVGDQKAFAELKIRFEQQLAGRVAVSKLTVVILSIISTIALLISLGVAISALKQ